MRPVDEAQQLQPQGCQRLPRPAGVTNTNGRFAHDQEAAGAEERRRTLGGDRRRAEPPSGDHIEGGPLHGPVSEGFRSIPDDPGPEAEFPHGFRQKNGSSLHRVEESPPSGRPQGRQYEAGDPTAAPQVECSGRWCRRPRLGKPLGVGDVGFERARTKESQRPAALENDGQRVSQRREGPPRSAGALRLPT